MPGIFGPDGKPAGDTPGGAAVMQLAQPLAGDALVALVAGMQLAAGFSPEDAIDRGITVTALALARCQSGELDKMLTAEKDRLAREAREAAIARVTGAKADTGSGDATEGGPP